MPSWAGTDMVTIWVLTRVSRSIRSGRRKVRPGWRTLVRSRPYRNTTPRSYCRTVCTEVASASAAAATTARMTTVHKKVISSTPLRFRGPQTYDPARHVRSEGTFGRNPAGQTGAPAPASAATLCGPAAGGPWSGSIGPSASSAPSGPPPASTRRAIAPGSGPSRRCGPRPPELAQGGVRGRDRLGLRSPGALLGHPLHRPGRLPGVEPRSVSSASIDAPRLANALQPAEGAPHRLDVDGLHGRGRGGVGVGDGRRQRVGLGPGEADVVAEVADHHPARGTSRSWVVRPGRPRRTARRSADTHPNCRLLASLQQPSVCEWPWRSRYSVTRIGTGSSTPSCSACRTRPVVTEPSGQSN